MRHSQEWRKTRRGIAKPVDRADPAVHLGDVSCPPVRRRRGERPTCPVSSGAGESPRRHRPMWLAGSVKRMPAIGAASFGTSSIGWVRPFSRITLQPVGKGASSSDADFGADPFHGAGRTSLDKRRPGPLGRSRRWKGRVIECCRA